LSSPAALLQKKRPCTRFPSVPRAQQMQALTDCRAALHSRPYSDMHDFKSLQTDERRRRSVLPWVVGEVLLNVQRTIEDGRSRFSTREVRFSSDLNLVPIIILGQQDQGPGIISVDPRTCVGKRTSAAAKTLETRHAAADQSPWYNYLPPYLSGPVAVQYQTQSRTGIYRRRAPVVHFDAKITNCGSQGVRLAEPQRTAEDQGACRRQRRMTCLSGPETSQPSPWINSLAAPLS